MKKTAALTLPLALAMLGVAGAARAQGSVTLYGMIDESVQYVHNTISGTNSLGLASSNISGTRWGLRGTEALNDDLSVVFRIENGFDPNTGHFNQKGRLFGRQSRIGLQSNRYGALTFGRQYDPLVDLIQPMTGDDPGGSAFTTPGDVDNNDDSSRAGNSVRYTSPALKGFQFAALYGFGNVPGHLGAGQTWAGAAAYAFGPFSAAAGYFHATSSAPPGGAWSGSSSGNFDGGANVPVDNYVNGPFITARSWRVAAAAVQYQCAPWRFSLRYSNVAYQPGAALAASFRTAQRYHVMGALAEYRIMPDWRLAAGYIFMRGSGSGAAQTWHQASFGADYWLSKQTDLYLLAAWQHASGHYGDGAPNVASIGDYGYGSNASHQEIVSLGMRHRF